MKENPMSIMRRDKEWRSSLSCESPLLSICIPTYNQPKEVGRVLETLVRQYTLNIEIIVHDGCDNDATLSVIEKYVDKLPIHYVRKNNRPVDLALLELIEMAKGEYIWWFGDDDFCEGALLEVTRIASLGEYAFIFANPIMAGTDTLHCSIIDRSREFETREELIESIEIGLGFLSSCVFRRQDALRGIESSKSRIGSSFANLYLMLFIIANARKSYFIKGPVVKCYPNTVEKFKINHVQKDGLVKNDAFFVFGVNACDIFESFSGQYDPVVIRKIVKKFFKRTWRGVLVATAGGYDTPHGKRFILLKRFWMFPESWLAFLLFLMPARALRPLYDFYKLLFRNKK
jgi:abequosyltransferase